jgi:hypothetical protein
VTVTFPAPSTGASGTFANGTATTTATTIASGVATASTFTANGTAGGPYTVAATVAGVATAANFSATNTTSGGGSGKVISIDFVGTGIPMGPTEIAGVVPKSRWNDESGVTSASPQRLVDETGGATGAMVSWKADNLHALPINDQPGNVRMMRGYLDDHYGHPTVVMVAGLPSNANGYNVYVYADGDNTTATRTGIYQISGADITTTSISLTDAANTNFSGTFTQANNSAGNYVVFPINATGFTLTVTAGASSTATRRAPVNGIQIVPR